MPDQPLRIMAPQKKNKSMIYYTFKPIYDHCRAWNVYFEYQLKPLKTEIDIETEIEKNQYR